MNALYVQVQEEIRGRAPRRRARADVGGGRRLRRREGLRRRRRHQGDAGHVLHRHGRALRRRCRTRSPRSPGIPKPTIAAITGYALGGGCELALACDFRVVADNAKLGQPEILLGIIPGAGGTQRLSRLVGPARAKDIIFSGRFVDAEEALRIGLVDKVVPADDVYAAARAWMLSFVGGPAYASGRPRRPSTAGSRSTSTPGWRSSGMLFASLFATKDREIGMTSFVQQGPGKAQNSRVDDPHPYAARGGPAAPVPVGPPRASPGAREELAVTAVPGRGPLDVLVFYSPSVDAEAVLGALFAAGAGAVGDYRDCAFVVRGTGQFRPVAGATPTDRRRRRPREGRREPRRARARPAAAGRRRRRAPGRPPLRGAGLPRHRGRPTSTGPDGSIGRLSRSVGAAAVTRSGSRRCCRAAGR